MIKGKCLCEKVEIEIDENPESFCVCHCSSCRKWSGGVSMSINGGKGLNFTGNDFISRYSSSQWAERGFCKQCGTNIFFRMKKSDHYFLLVGLFGNEISPKFEAQEYIDDKPDFYCFANETKSITKPEMQKMLQDFLEKP